MTQFADVQDIQNRLTLLQIYTTKCIHNTSCDAIFENTDTHGSSDRQEQVRYSSTKQKKANQSTIIDIVVPSPAYIVDKCKAKIATNHIKKLVIAFIH